MGKLCIGNASGVVIPGALKNYGEMHILESDAYSGLMVFTPLIVDDLHEGVSSGVTLDGSAGQFTINTAGPYEAIMLMSFFLSGVTVAATVAFYLDGVLLPDTVKVIGVQVQDDIKFLGTFGQFEVAAEDLPAILELRISSPSARTIDIEHLAFGIKGIG